MTKNQHHNIGHYDADDMDSLINRASELMDDEGDTEHDRLCGLVQSIFDRVMQQFVAEHNEAGTKNNMFSWAALMNDQQHRLLHLMFDIGRQYQIDRLKTEDWPTDFTMDDISGIKDDDEAQPA